MAAIDFEPAGAETYAAATSVVAGELSSAAATTTAAVEAVPDLGAIGADFVAAFVATTTAHANEIDGAAAQIAGLGQVIDTYSAKVSASVDQTATQLQQLEVG